jgi:hypothetical protein
VDDDVTTEGDDSMSKEAFREIVEPRKGLVETIMPGLSLDKIVAEIGAELRQMGVHGAHEAAAALFNNSGFVMYPRAGREQEALNKILEAPSIAPPTPAIEHDRGGIER